MATNQGQYEEDSPSEKSLGLVGIVLAELMAPASQGAVGGVASGSTTGVAAGGALAIGAAGLLGAGLINSIVNPHPSGSQDPIEARALMLAKRRIEAPEEVGVQTLADGAKVDLPTKCGAECGEPSPKLKELLERSSAASQPDPQPAPQIAQPYQRPKGLLQLEPHALVSPQLGTVSSVKQQQEVGKKTKAKCTGPCEYPHDVASDGSRCGGRSASSRGGSSCSSIRV